MAREKMKVVLGLERLQDRCLWFSIEDGFMRAPFL
jgi:hypothetical protein